MTSSTNPADRIQAGLTSLASRRSLLRGAVGVLAGAVVAGAPVALAAHGRDHGGDDGGDGNAATSRSGSSRDDNEDTGTLLQFARMAAVTGPFVKTATVDNPINGVHGGGLPWIISEARGELSSNGRIEVRVRGLVLAKAAPVPPNLQGTNPVSAFHAVVSCQTIDAAGNPATVNVHTGSFAATPTGNADIEDTVSLPMPCFGVIVFVTSPAGTNPTGSWFAVTGQ